MPFNRTADPDIPVRDPYEDSFREQRGPLIHPPHDMLVHREGNAIRLAAIERGRYISSGPVSAATKYVFRWVEAADLSTQEKLDAAFTRSVLVDQVARTYVEREAIYGTLLTDAKYGSGYFFCVGMNEQGDASRYIVSALQSNEILNGAIPGPVTDLQISESGEQANDTVYSKLSFTYVSPTVNGAAFTGIEPIIDDYPRIGDRTEYGRLLYDGPPNRGAGGGDLRIPPARRVGNGTISIAGTAVTGTSTTFTQFAKADDQLEVFGVRRRISTVNSDTSITLTAAWPTTPAVSSVGQYVVIGKCRVFAVSLSQTQEHSYDESTWPYVDVDLDGELSAPNAPATLTLVPFGNGIRGQFVQVAGTGIKEYPVYRSTGTTDNIATATLWFVLKHDPTLPVGSTVLQFEDTKFTTYERENGQVFRYYIRTVNVRDEPSSGYVTATAECRLDSGADTNDPRGKLGLKNLLFNGGFGGTTGNTVASNETSQHNSFSDIIVGTDEPGRAYGTPAGDGGQMDGLGKYRGYTMWGTGDGGTGAGGARPTFQGGEVLFTSPGSGGKAWYLVQEIEAWDSAKGAAFLKMKKDGTCCWQVKLARQVGGSQPDGIVGIYIDLYDNNTFRAEAPRRQRNSATDVLEYVTGSSAHIDISCADLVTDWTRFYGIFKLDSSVGTVKQVRVNVVWVNGTQGNVRVAEAMVNDGEEVGVFSVDMGDKTIAWPVPTNPPGDFGDGDGLRDGRFLQP